MKSGIWKTVAAMGVWALVHSALATRHSKRLAARALGEQGRNGLYRVGYNGIAVVTTFGLVWYIRQLPDRKLYAVHGPGRAALRAGQAAMLLAMARAAGEIGIGPFSGVSELGRFLLRRPTEDAPEAQGPSVDREGGELRTGGPYRFVRHPLNAGATALLFLNPEMTAVRFTIALVTLAYSLGGSKLEERRLLARYGEPYRKYLESGVPFFVPRLLR